MALKVINLKKHFGIKDDGRNYTEELQAAADLAYLSIEKYQNAPLLRFPPYAVKHSDTLVLRGNQGGGPWVQGMAGDGYSVFGSNLVWAGAQDKPQVYAQECNQGRWWDVAVDGSNIAGRNLWIGASKWNDWTVLKATNGFSVRRSRMSRVRPGVEGNGCLAFGTDVALTGGATYQSSGWSVRDCIFVPEQSGAPGFSFAGMKAFGFKTMSPGNCKSGELINCSFTACNKAIDWQQSSGFLRVSSVQMADVRRAFESTSGQLTVSGGNIECGHVDDFRLLYGTGQTGCYASIKGLEVSWDTAQGVLPVLLEYAGGVLLEHNNFGYKGWLVPFGMKATCLTRGQGGTFRSRQNWYAACGSDRPYIPIYDGSGPGYGNDLSPAPGTYGAVTWLDLKSSGDTGGTGNGFRLNSFDATTH